MTDFLREWAKHYRIRFIIALILCVFFVYSIIAVQTSDSPWGMIIIAFMLSTIIWDRLREFNSSFEGLLVDKYYERVRGWRGTSSKDYYFKFSKGGREFIRQVELKQYEVAEIGDYVNRFGWQITPASDSTDNT